MKHSKKEKKPEGFSKGESNDRKRQGPIMIEEILKCDLTIREMMMRTDPTNESSPVIKRKFKPLDNPSNVLDVLQGEQRNNRTVAALVLACWCGRLT
jgi:hypothetical protein